MIKSNWRLTVAGASSKLQNRRSRNHAARQKTSQCPGSIDNRMQQNEVHHEPYIDAMVEHIRVCTVDTLVYPRCTLAHGRSCRTRRAEELITDCIQLSIVPAKRWPATVTIIQSTVDHRTEERVRHIKRLWAAKKSQLPDLDQQPTDVTWWTWTLSGRSESTITARLRTSCSRQIDDTTANQLRTCRTLFQHQMSSVFDALSRGRLDAIHSLTTQANTRDKSAVQ